MTDARWVCRRCFANNTDADFTCGQCGLMRGSDPPAGDPTTPAWVKPPAPRSPLLGMLARFWWIPAIGVVLAVGFLTNAQRGSGGEITQAGTVQLSELRIGDCFDTAATGELSDVDGKPCTQPHEFELYYVVDWDRADTYPTEAQLDEFIVEKCVPAFYEYVRRTYESSVLDIFTVYPTQESWNRGDREFQCALYQPGNTELTTTLRGANR